MTANKNLPKGKYELELNFPGDGRIFLNFWDWVYGNDVVAEIVNGQLYYTPPEGEQYEVQLETFLDLVIESINKRTV